jgi:hypothetical protein
MFCIDSTFSLLRANAKYQSFTSQIEIKDVSYHTPAVESLQLGIYVKV